MSKYRKAASDWAELRGYALVARYTGWEKSQIAKDCSEIRRTHSPKGIYLVGSYAKHLQLNQDTPPRIRELIGSLTGKSKESDRDYYLDPPVTGVVRGKGYDILPIMGKIHVRLSEGFFL